jgi:hypothetical protein
MGSASIVFSYTSDPLVRASLREFRAYPIDAQFNRLGEAVVVAPDSIPTSSNPLIVPMPPSAIQIEVVPVDIDGHEGKAAYA